MSEPIRVGDLVVVVRSEHECTTRIYGGAVFTVTGFEPQTGGGWTCGRCGAVNLLPNILEVALGLHKYGVPVPWLRRIPPLAELDEAERKEETPA